MKKTLKLQGQNKTIISVHTWQPQGAIQGCIHILHGMAEHGLRYEAFAEFMKKEGYVVWVHDHRQHGQSIGHHTYGIFGPDDTWAAMIDDTAMVQKHFSQAYPDCNMHMIGHSMGSVVLRGYLQTMPTKVSSAVVMGSPVGNKPLLVSGLVIASIASKFNGYTPSPSLNHLTVGGFNKTILKPRSPFDWISKDPHAVDLYGADPMCGYAYNPSFYKEFCRGMLMVNRDRSMERFPKIAMMILSGEDDPAGDFGQGVRRISQNYRRLGLDHELVLMAGMRHEVLNEVDRIKSYRVVRDFINGLKTRG